MRLTRKIEKAIIILLVLWLLVFSQNSSISGDQDTKICNTPLQPPTNNNWIVKEPKLVENEIITLNGNLSIQIGGELTLRNVTLRMNCSSGREFHIAVEGGGALTIESNSTVMAVSQIYPWYLQAHNNSIIYLRDSNFFYGGKKGGWAEYGAYSGLWFNTDNVRILNCRIAHMADGISLYEAMNCLVANNSIINCDTYGISLWDVLNCTIDNNSITDCGLRGIILSGQTLGAANNTISHNSVRNIDGVGIYLGNSNNSIIANNRVTNTSNNAIYLAYSGRLGVRGNTIMDSGLIGIVMGYSSKSIINNNTVTDCSSNGLYLSHSYESSVKENSLGDCFDAFLMADSSNNTVLNNRITNSKGHGVILRSVSNATISGNTITSSSDYGIYLNTSTALCSVWGNILAANGRNAWDDSHYYNVWDNGTHGNWWDDYIGSDSNFDGVGDTPYPIAGEGLSMDRFPLMQPLGPDHYPPQINQPADITYTEGETGHRIAWEPYDVHPGHFAAYRNGTIVATGLWNGTTIYINLEELPRGYYNYTLVVHDSYGNQVSDTVWVTVLQEEPRSRDSQVYLGFLFAIITTLLAGVVSGA
ncbi:MAG: nitrous oxide reductase family maturation protein NosD, partial [Candidatus Hodarchaeota archaeon]